MKRGSVLGNLLGFSVALVITTIILMWTPVGRGYFKSVQQNMMNVVKFMDKHGSQQ